MVAIYVLKLSRGKYYVGMTRKNIDRVLTHIDGRGAAWTKKYPPSGTKPILSFQEGLRESDEDRITLETMKRFGVENVRGGSWCKVNMTRKEIQMLEKKIATKKKPATKTTTQRKKPATTKSPTCSRCGRVGHNRTKCYAKTTVDGVSITTKSWKYKPKKSTKKKTKSRRNPLQDEMDILNSPFGHPFKLDENGRLARDRFGRPIMKSPTRKKKKK